MTENVRYSPIPSFPGYFAGSDGTVWSQFKTGKSELSPSVWRQRATRVHSKSRYHCVNLLRNRKKYCCLVHRLVLEAFVGPCPPGMLCCHYPDQTRTNNRLENLRWDTQAQNNREKISLERTTTLGVKLVESDILRIRLMRANGATQKSIAETFKVSQSLISLILAKRLWKNIAEVHG